MRKFFLVAFVVITVVFAVSFANAQMEIKESRFIKDFDRQFSYLSIMLRDEIGMVKISALCPKKGSKEILETLLRKNSYKNIYVGIVDAHCRSIWVKWEK